MKDNDTKSNKGVVTIVVSLILMVMITLVLIVAKGVRIKCARIRAVTALSSAVSSIKADYNPYIFENYHILLFDSTYYGCGEGKTEELIREYLEYTLGGSFNVKDVKLSAVNTIQMNDCSALKYQINDYMKYSLIESGTELVLKKIGISPDKADKAVDDETLKAMDEETLDAITKDKEDGKDPEKKAEDKKKTEKKTEKKDPRFVNRIMGGATVAVLMLPEDAEFSQNIIDIFSVPSYSGMFYMFSDDVSHDFSDYSALRGDLTSSNGWGNSFTNNAAAIAYCSEVFKSLRSKKENKTYVNMEKEYIICGYPNDYLNYSHTVRKLIKLRLGFNFAYLLTDAGRMARVSALATVLTAYAPFLQPVVKYLLAGCWSYIESIADVNFLVKGHKVKLIKSSEDWCTDIYDNLAVFNRTIGNEDKEKGLDYDEYLMILMAATVEKMYDRILDIFELNAGIDYPDFRIKNAAVEFSVNTEIEYEGVSFDLYKETDY